MQVVLVVKNGVIFNVMQPEYSVVTIYNYDSKKPEDLDDRKKPCRKIVYSRYGYDKQMNSIVEVHYTVVIRWKGHKMIESKVSKGIEVILRNY